MTNKRTILCLVPLSPPVTGAALASEAVLSHLAIEHDLTVLPYQRGTLVIGKFSFKQLFRILWVGWRLFRLRMSVRLEHAYLVVSSTFLGNMRDLLFMTLMGGRLRRSLVVHLHGSNFDRYLLAAPAWVRFINRKFYAEIKGAIVLGESLSHMFDGYVPRQAVHCIKNFFDPMLLIPEYCLTKKFEEAGKVHFLYLSNLIKVKGYEILLDAFLALDESLSSKAVLHFAGNFYSEAEEKAFTKKIADKSNIIYHGCVHGEIKQKLLWSAHVFCLPTFYIYEGQPISILEAYASGCAVLTTNSGGIVDIFTNSKNGFYVNEKIDFCMEDIKRYLVKFIGNIHEYKSIGMNNRQEAVQKYQQHLFGQQVEAVVLGGS